jgi:hypothetical protein
MLKSMYANIKITILSLEPEIMNLNYSRQDIDLFIPNKGVKKDLFFIFRFAKLICNLSKILKAYDKNTFDIIHIHYFTYYIGLLRHSLLHCGKKTVMSIWGSDFYKVKNRHIALQKMFLPSVTRISFSNQETLDAFTKRFGAKYKKISRVCRFGLFPLQDIKELESMSKEQAKRIIGIDENRIAITCGYYADRVFQHSYIIQQINQLPEELKTRISLLFPFTYGEKEIYARSVEEQARKTEIPFLSFKQRLSDRNIALIRKASDILIHIPFNDQFSGTMQEYLFADNAIICGSWLPYHILEQKGIKLIKIDRLEELLSTLENTIRNIKERHLMNSSNKTIIWELSSWQTNFQKWENFYTDRSD